MIKISCTCIKHGSDDRNINIHNKGNSYSYKIMLFVNMIVVFGNVIHSKYYNRPKNN